MTQSSLALARDIKRPTREAMLQRAPSVQHFWNDNTNLFENAWKEWEQTEDIDGVTLDETNFAPALRAAVDAAWNDPTDDAAVKDLWDEVFPGVYKAQFFDPEKLRILRGYMDKAANADIPLRPPYGISLNRAGAMLDPRSEGYLGAPGFQAFYHGLMNRYMRPGEGFSGSGGSFIDPEARRVESLKFDPGVALIHHGSVPHASEPITEGSRSNFVLWLYGQHGQVARGEAEVPALAPEDRWTVPNVPSDGFAPF